MSYFLGVKNRAVSSLASGVTDVATSWALAAGEGAKFPAAGDFHVTCEDEIAKVTARSTDTLTVVRAQEGTTAVAHDAGRAVELRITAGIVTEIQGKKAIAGWTLDKILKGAGAGVDPTEIDAPQVTGNSILEKLQKHLGVWWFNNNWLPAGMVSTGASGSGNAYWYASYVMSQTGATLNSYIQLYKAALGLSGAYSWDKKRFFGVYVYLDTYSAQNIHIVSGYCPGTGAANTYRHIGFKLIDDTLYGTVADGTTEATTTAIETLTAAVYRRLECVLDPSIPECRFYVGGVDKGAITTNLPTGITDSDYLLCSTIHNTEANYKDFYFLEARTFQEE